MPDRKGVEGMLYKTLVVPEQWREDWVWIGDNRYQIYKSDSVGTFKYGVFKEVWEGIDQSGQFVWEFQNCFAFLWTARFYLWRLERTRRRTSQRFY